MNPPAIGLRKLRLEWLESRTLLAGLGFDDALAQVSPAVSSGSNFTIGFSERIGRSELFVTGVGSGAMTIDFDRLPSFVTAVTISSFDSVTFTGHDTLTKLVATDIQTLDADHISIGIGLYANNVQTVSLATGGGIAVLNGTSTKLDIANLQATLIISDLQHLSINSGSANISVVSLNSTQKVQMLYPAEQVSVAGLTDPISQVLFLPATVSAPTDGTSSSGQPGPADGNAGGGGSTTSGTFTSGNVITITPNEQTNILIARIRDILRSGSSANPLAVVESMGQIDLGLAGTSALLSARPDPTWARETIGAPSSNVAPISVVVAANSLLPTLGQMELRSADFLPTSPDVPELDAKVEGIVANPDALADLGLLEPLYPIAPSSNVQADDALVTREAQELFLETLPIDNRTLKDVVIQGMVGEISPAERTAFLLVDPKPPRSSHERNRESSIQEIA